MSVIPVSALTLDHVASRKRISTGVADLDKMLDGAGYFKGSTILISGMAGTGKTSLSASFAEAACKRGEKTMYFCFEESQDQLFRNMESIGVNLSKWEKNGMLKVIATRPSFYGIEMHLLQMSKAIESFGPTCLVVDPISNMASVGAFNEIRAMMMRLIDILKSKQITTVFTSLNSRNKENNESDGGIASLIDTWISVREIANADEQNRALCVLKSRGMPHSNKIREFVLTKDGISLIDVYSGSAGVLTGSARRADTAARATEQATRNAQ